MKPGDGRKNSHRKGVAIGHHKHTKRAKKAAPYYSMEQMRRDVDAGCRYFWSRPKRRHLREGGML